MRSISNRLLLLAGVAMAVLAGNAASAMLFKYTPLSSVAYGFLPEALIATSVALLIIAAFLYPPLRRETDEIEILKTITEASNEAVMVTSSDSVIEYVNDAFTAITGYESADVVGKTPGIMKSGRHDETFYEDMRTSLRETGKWQGEVWDKKKSGEVFPKWLTIRALKDGGGRTRKYVGVFTDLTYIKESNEQVDFLIQHDRLTGLPNRTLFMSLLKQAMAHASSGKSKLAVLNVDIESFGSVNESFGFAGGDRVLKETAARLLSAIPKTGTVARTGPDDFSIILQGIGKPPEAVPTAETVLRLMSNNFTVRATPLHLGVNIGISVFPDDGDEPDDLLTKAGKALHLSREKGSNYYQFFNEEIPTPAIERLRVENNIRLALEHKELVLHYQPKVDLGSGRVIGAEALVRRQEPDWLVPAGVFIEIAEETGLIVEICEWTLFEACEQHMRWLKAGVPPVCISVNFTARQFQQERAVSKVEEAIARTGMDPKYLEIEVTERTIMYNSKRVIETLHELKALGVSLSIDDFGIGYSSIGYLKQFPIDTIKVDISFIKEITTSEQSAMIVNAIINLSHNLGFKVLAEGVETALQLEFLRAHGCDEIQGHYFSWAVPPDAFGELVRSGRHLEEMRIK